MDTIQDEAFGAAVGEGALESLEKTVNRHPLNREILIKTLRYCYEERALRDVEEKIQTYPEFAQCTQNPYRLVRFLVDAGGLDEVERAEDGSVVRPEDKEGLTEDEVDDLVCELGYVTTEAGRTFAEANLPEARLRALLGFALERRGVYLEVLEFIAQAPRSYAEVKELLAGHPVLEVTIDGMRQTMQPSVFVDKLERAGALVWDGGWRLTDGGLRFLEESRAAEEGEAR